MEERNELKELKKRIEDRFKRKIKGRVLIKLSDGSRLRVEYMYGAKYCLLKRAADSKNVVTLTMLASAEEVAKLILREKNGPDLKQDLGSKLKGLTASLKSRSKKR